MDPAVLIQVWDEWAQFPFEAQGPETGCYLSWATEPAPCRNQTPLSLLVWVRSLQEQFHNHSACWSSVKSKLRSFRAFCLLCCSSRLCCVLFSDCKMKVSSCVSCDDGVIFPVGCAVRVTQKHFDGERWQQKRFSSCNSDDQFIRNRISWWVVCMKRSVPVCWHWHREVSAGVDWDYVWLCLILLAC